MLLAALLLLAAPARGERAPDHPTFNRHTGLFEPPFSELEHAVEHGDRAEVARWAARIGPARLAAALRGNDHAALLAAVEAAPLLPGNVRLLDAVAPLVASSDASVAERAARAVGDMLDGSEPRRLDDWDIPADEVSRACRALSEAATRSTAAQPVRLAALDALADAGGSCWPAPLSTLLSDAAPAIRRAALLALRPRDEITAADLQRALGDPDPTVVSAAAVVWCRRRQALPATAPLVTPPVRALALADATPTEDAVELVPCLAASSDPADRQAFEQLKHSKVTALRTRATELSASR